MHEGGFVNICLGYEKDILTESKLLSLISLLIEKLSSLRFKYIKDESGEHWVDEQVDFKKLESILSEYNGMFYLTIDITGSLLNIDIECFSIDVFREKEFNSIRITIPWYELFENNHKNWSGQLLSDEIIRILAIIYKETKYSYAICGNEAEADYSPVEFKRRIENGAWEYDTICVLPKESKLEVYKGEYGVDGMSKQEKEIINLLLQSEKKWIG